MFSCVRASEEIHSVNLVLGEERILLGFFFSLQLEASDKLHSTFQLKQAEIQPVHNVSKNKTPVKSLVRFDPAIPLLLFLIF